MEENRVEVLSLLHPVAKGWRIREWLVIHPCYASLFNIVSRFMTALPGVVRVAVITGKSCMLDYVA